MIAYPPSSETTTYHHPLAPSKKRNLKKYQPKYNKSCSWEEIELWYIELIEHGLDYEPMLNLVRHIRITGLHERLFGFTSMHKLVIGIYEEIEWDREALHIEFNITYRKWYFKYLSKPFEPIEFERKYEENLGIEKLEQFVKNINW